MHGSLRGLSTTLRPARHCLVGVGGVVRIALPGGIQHVARERIGSQGPPDVSLQRCSLSVATDDVGSVRDAPPCQDGHGGIRSGYRAS